MSTCSHVLQQGSLAGATGVPAQRHAFAYSSANSALHPDHARERPRKHGERACCDLHIRFTKTGQSTIVCRAPSAVHTAAGMPGDAEQASAGLRSNRRERAGAGASVWTCGAGGWERTSVDPQYKRHCFGIDEHGAYFEQLDDDDVFARHKYLSGMRTLELPVYETDPPCDDEAAGDAPQHAAFEESHLPRGRNWEFELFTSACDAAAVTVVHKDTQSDTIVVCVPQHHVSHAAAGGDAPVALVGPAAAAALQPGARLHAYGVPAWVAYTPI